MCSENPPVELSKTDLDKARALKQTAIDALNELRDLISASVDVVMYDEKVVSNCIEIHGPSGGCVEYCEPPGVCRPCGVSSDPTTEPIVYVFR